MSSITKKRTDLQDVALILCYIINFIELALFSSVLFWLYQNTNTDRTYFRNAGEAGKLFWDYGFERWEYFFLAFNILDISFSFLIEQSLFGPFVLGFNTLSLIINFILIVIWLVIELPAANNPNALIKLGMGNNDFFCGTVEALNLTLYNTNCEFRNPTMNPVFHHNKLLSVNSLSWRPEFIMYTVVIFVLMFLKTVKTVANLTLPSNATTRRIGSGIATGLTARLNKRRLEETDPNLLEVEKNEELASTIPDPRERITIMSELKKQEAKIKEDIRQFGFALIRSDFFSQWGTMEKILYVISLVWGAICIFVFAFWVGLFQQDFNPIVEKFVSNTLPPNTTTLVVTTDWTLMILFIMFMFNFILYSLTMFIGRSTFNMVSAVASIIGVISNSSLFYAFYLIYGSECNFPSSVNNICNDRQFWWAIYYHLHPNEAPINAHLAPTIPASELKPDFYYVFLQVLIACFILYYAVSTLAAVIIQWRLWKLNTKTFGIEDLVRDNASSTFSIMIGQNHNNNSENTFFKLKKNKKK